MTRSLELGRDRGPELGVEWYREKGGWVVSTPVFAAKQEEDIQRAMVCPHWEYKEVKSETIADPDTGKDVLIVVERCAVCVAQRFRHRPMTQELFTKEPPLPPEGLCPTEKIFRFPTFILLARRMQFGPAAPINMLSYVEAGGHAHSVIMPLSPAPFAGTALETVKDMRRILRMGPVEYVNYMNFMEHRKTAAEKTEKAGHAGTLFPVGQAAGEPVLAEAENTLTNLAQEEARKIMEMFGDPEKAEQIKELRNLEAQSYMTWNAIWSGQLSPAEQAQAQQRVSELDAEIQALRQEIGI